ncbi:MAG: hypothetical protein AAF485_32440, partial [Chloroflexota bacterium]
MGEKRFHPYAEIYPLLEGDEFSELVEQIRLNGLIDDITLDRDDGSILDGRNRYRACLVANVAPRYAYFNGQDKLGFVVAKNTRRHMTASQKAIAAAKLEHLFAEEAKRRQGQRNDIVEKIPRCEQGKSRDKAGQMMGVNGRYVSDAKKIV